MENKVRFSRWSFLLIWIGASLLAFIIVEVGNIAQAVYEVLGYNVGTRAPLGMPLPVTGQKAEQLDLIITIIALTISGVIYGVITGVIQSAILKPHIGKSRWWLATTLGYGVANLISYPLFSLLDVGYYCWDNGNNSWSLSMVCDQKKNQQSLYMDCDCYFSMVAELPCYLLRSKLYRVVGNSIGN